MTSCTSRTQEIGDPCEGQTGEILAVFESDRKRRRRALLLYDDDDVNESSGNRQPEVCVCMYVCFQTSFVRRVYLSLVSAETDCSFSSREGNLLVLVWIGSKRQILAHSSSLLYHSICALII